MNEDPEPSENISGGESGGGSPAEFAAGEAATRAEAVVDRLGELYWQKTYGGQDAFECLVRTVLSQNTSDKASQPAHDALMARYGTGGAEPSDDSTDRPEAPCGGDLAASLAAADVDDLADTIRHAGLYNQKARTLVDLAERVLDEFGGVDASGTDASSSQTASGPAAGFDAFVKDGDPADVRETLLDLHGVGPKTADCVLLFAGGRTGVFPVDTHVHRLYRRLGVAPPGADHEAVREVLERDVPPEKCGFGHTASIQFGRDYCTATNPACLDGPEACPLYHCCDRVGVDEVAGDAVDPAATE